MGMSKKINDIWKEQTYFERIINFIGIIIMIYGIHTSIFMNSVNRSLWLDEASLTQSIMTRGFWGLISKQLDNMQAAPLLYLWIEKLNVSLFGGTEYVLRVYSVIAYLLTILLAAVCAIQCNIKYPFLISAFLANNRFLLDYSNQVKQYMNECFWVLLLIVIYNLCLNNNKTFKLKYGIVFTFTCFLCILGGNPSIFMAGGILICEFVSSILHKNKDGLKRTIIIGIIVVAFFAIYYLFFLKRGNSEGMQNYWKNNFLLLKLDKTSQNKNINLLNSVCNMVFSATMFRAAILIGFLIALYKKNRTIISMTICLLLGMCASIVHMFPIEQRLWLFSIPVGSLIMFYGINQIFTFAIDSTCKQPEKPQRKMDFWNIILVILLVAFIIGENGIELYLDSAHVYHSGEEANDLIAYVQQNINSDEKAFIYFHSIPVTKFKIGYDVNRIGNTDSDNIIWSAGPATDENNLNSDFDNIVQAKRCYIITSHVVDKRWLPLKTKLEEVGTVTEALNSHNTYLYYFEISE